MNSIKKRRINNIISAVILITLLAMTALLSGCGSGSEESSSVDSSSADTGSEASADTRSGEAPADVQSEKAAFAEYFKALTDDAAVKARDNMEKYSDDTWQARLQGHDVNGDGVADMFVYSLPSTTGRSFYAAAYSGGKVVETPVYPSIMAIDIPVSVYWLNDGSGFMMEEYPAPPAGDQPAEEYYQFSRYAASADGFICTALEKVEIDSTSEASGSAYQDFIALCDKVITEADVTPGEECDMTVGQVKMAANYDEFAALLSGYGIALK